jgi:hypothetical protein
MRRKHAIVTCCSIAMVLAQAGETYGAPLQGRAPQAIQDQYVPDPPGGSVDAWVTGLSIPPGHWFFFPMATRSPANAAGKSD